MQVQEFLQESVSASEQLMNSGKFALNDWDVEGTYENAANPGKLYTIYNSISLNGNSEVIFYKHYEKVVVSHGLCDYTSGSTTQAFSLLLPTTLKAPRLLRSCTTNIQKS